MSAVVLDEGIVHYEAIGRGRPLVFVHGWLGSWRYWIPAMEDLSVNHRVYAFDLWGFGDSDKTGKTYSIDAYVDLLRKFLEKMGVTYPPTLVGHALGGVVALRFAVQTPGEVGQVLGVSVPLAGEAINRQLAGVSGSRDALMRLVARRAKFPEVETEVVKTDVSAVTNSVRSTMEDDLHGILPRLEMPVLLVYGGNDPLIKPPQEEWLRNCDEHVRAISLDGAYHFPMLEERTKFNRLLKSFLEVGDDLDSLELKEEWQRRMR